MEITETKLPNLSGSDGLVIDKKMTIPGKVELKHDNYNLPWVIFKNITFSNYFIAKDVNFNIGVGFEKCVFEREVFFVNVSSNGHDKGFSKDSNSIYFLDCVFEGFVQFRGENTAIDRSLKFADCKLNKGLELNNIRILTQSLLFDNCTISNKLDINDCFVKQHIGIGESTLETRVRLYKGKVDSIAMVKSTFKKDLRLWGCEITNSITFNNGEFEEDVNINVIGGNPNISIIGGKYKESFSVDYEDKSNNVIKGLKNLYFDSCEFSNGLFINGVQDKSSDRPLTESMVLKITSKMQGDISVSSLHVGSIEISGINSKATIKFTDIWVNTLSMDEFYNHSQMVLVGIRASHADWYRDVKKANGEILKDKINSKLYILNSNLGKAQLYAFNFKSFSRINIYNTILSEIIVSNVKWFDPENLKLVDDEVWTKGYKKTKIVVTEADAVVVDYLSRREIFRQLKYACDKQGDKFQALEFQRWEMVYYKKYLEILKHKNRSDRFILWTNQTNDFGQNWIKALRIGFIFTFILYIPIALLGSSALVPLSLAKTSEDVVITLKEVFWNQLPAYIQLVNPAHILSRIYSDIDNRPGVIHFFDAVHRLITGFFIFQIISAFRKYVK